MSLKNSLYCIIHTNTVFCLGGSQYAFQVKALIQTSHVVSDLTTMFTFMWPFTSVDDVFFKRRLKKKTLDMSDSPCELRDRVCENILYHTTSIYRSFRPNE